MADRGQYGPNGLGSMPPKRSIWGDVIVVGLGVAAVGGGYLYMKSRANRVDQARRDARKALRELTEAQNQIVNRLARIK